MDHHMQATKRYMRIFVPAMLAYLIGVFGVSWADNHSLIPEWSLYVLTIIPVLAIFAWMWAQWRYVNELDEYLKKIQTEAMMIGLMIVTAIASGWGLMELMTDVPRIPIFFAGPGFYMVYGIAYAVLAKRVGIKGNCL